MDSTSKCWGQGWESWGAHLWQDRPSTHQETAEATRGLLNTTREWEVASDSRKQDPHRKGHPGQCPRVLTTTEHWNAGGDGSNGDPLNDIKMAEAWPKIMTSMHLKQQPAILSAKRGMGFSCWEIKVALQIRAHFYPATGNNKRHKWDPKSRRQPSSWPSST